MAWMALISSARKRRAAPDGPHGARSGHVY
jgi:hypothetical protein